MLDYEFLDGDRREVEVFRISYDKGYRCSEEVARFHCRDYHDPEQEAIDLIAKLSAEEEAEYEE